MTVFLLLTCLGTAGAIVSSIGCVRAEEPGYSLRRPEMVTAGWLFAFYCAVFLTILSAPLA